MRPHWVLGAVVLASLGAACKGDSKQDANAFHIGVITSLTGSTAAFGQAHKNGYAVAVAEINAKGGILGKPVELLYYDDQSKPDQAVQGVAKLVDQDHVPLILGAYSSENTRAIVPAVTQKHVPLLMPTATADNVMESGSPWVFRICAGADAYAAATLDFLKHNGDPKTIAIVYENTNFGQANDKSMKTAATAAGLTVVDEEAYQASSPDYKALLQRVAAKAPDAVYFASYLLDATTLLRQSEQVGLSPKFITSAGTGFAAAEFPTEKGAGKFAEYTFSVSQWLPTAKWAGSAEFDAAFTKLTGSHPAYHAMEAYASLLVAADAINGAKSDQPQAIADAIRKEKLATPFGPIAFDDKGQNHHPVLITQVQGGQYKVVWPADAAEAKPLATPAWSERK
ncbi:MAG TPA: ABC transporter substrate-binding protein [Kofleriaceae bacterium]|jgi:branched-chain amino acid transport system substrate-binding protein|nr:ABC transporter substrate-binding protein [Kofleriaceae bacterium]